MSWNKNTYRNSEINTMLDTLREVLPNEHYTLTCLGEVGGYGLNDHDDEMYEIRKLEFKNIVVIEQMQRTHDCDSDDIIVSFKYRADRAPTNLPLDIYMDCEKFGCDKHTDGTCSPSSNNPYDDYDTEMESFQHMSDLALLEEENINEDDKGIDIHND